MNLVESLKWRYAVKKFDHNKTLSEEKVTILKDAFNLSASSYGLQPVKLLVIKNKEIQKELVAHSWNQRQVVDASHLLVFCIPKTFSKNEVENYFNLVKSIRNTPDSIINPFKEFLTTEVEKKSQEEIYNWNKNQAYLALGNLLTVCAAENIDSCPMEGFVPEEYDRVLNLEAQNLTSIIALPIGFRAEDDFMKDLKKVRKNLDEVIVEYN